ncbi:uncharacterized protein BYT42DRAFT_62717 [Radiomyces spectabilis]|uniref:uncharacterized protein n=1 Tax=Radiomyces spectabilis TaxID=64574 RepID=UPI0022204F84|nr:uncharacterized protein BYT42DRAFT_62717 [Radiomyces spectabilis]KAI8373224.1 hypothetical protein BYT42DRAFT_62717 [Radiomyces spectabilis]
MAGRPQFAQRVKRWMHKYKIDCYFDYLLGNEFNFHSADEKYTGCLMMGNYQKRRLDRSRAADEAESVHPPEDSETHNKRRRVVDRRRRRSLSTEEVQSIVDDEDDNTFSDTATSRTHEFEKHRGPIVFAGSRKRLREVDPSNLRFMDNVRRVQHSAKDESEHPMDDDMEESDAVANSDEEQQMEAESTSGSVQLANSPSASPGENQDDEEDELASSSVGSPDGSIMSDFHSAEDELNLDNPVETEDDSSIEHPPLHSETTAVDSSFAQPSLFHNQTSTNEAAAGPSVSEPSFSLDLDSSSESKDSTTLCANCHQVPMMKKEIQQLKDHIALLEKKLQEQQKAASTKETDLSQQLQERNEMCEKYERWRKDMAKLFLQEPSLTSSPPKNNLDVDTS